MPFDWSQYLALAEELAERQNDEAALRSAISRAHYAAFCLARNRLRQEGVALPRTGAAHGMIWATYRETAGSSTRRSIGHIGDRLRVIRNMADYDDTVVDLVSWARFALSRARLVLTLLNSI